MNVESHDYYLFIENVTNHSFDIRMTSGACPYVEGKFRLKVGTDDNYWDDMEMEDSSYGPIQQISDNSHNGFTHKIDGADKKHIVIDYMQE